MADWKHIDFERLYKVLFIRAVGVVRDASRCFDMGISAEDLVNETFIEFLESPNGLGWSEKRGSLDALLCGVLVNKARSHLRRDKKVAESLDEENHGFPLHDSRPTQAVETEWKDFSEKLLCAVGDDEGLRDLITAVEFTTGAHNVNQELADTMSKTAHEAVNLKRRLMNNQKVLGIYGKG